MNRLFRTCSERPEFPLIDAHVHVGPSDSDEIYYPTLGLAEYSDLMESCGIERACVFPPLRQSGYRTSNEAIRAECSRSKGRALPFARIGGRTFPPTWEPWALRRQVRKRLRPSVDDFDSLEGFAGVKLLPHLDGLPSAETLAEMDSLGMPVVIHGGVHCRAGWIDKVLVDRYRAPVIIAHLGAFPCGERELFEAVELARLRENVFLDTSAAWLSEFLRYAIEKVPEKVVFGSDCPAVHPAVAWSHVASVVRKDEWLERIGRTTLASLLDERRTGPDGAPA